MKSSPRGIDMAIPIRALAVGEETLRHNQLELVPGVCHSNIKQAPLLLDFSVGGCGEIRRNASVDDVQYEDRAPFLTLGRMDGREDQIILIQQRNPGVTAGRVWRIQRQVCQKVLS